MNYQKQNICINPYISFLKKKKLLQVVLMNSQCVELSKNRGTFKLLIKSLKKKKQEELNYELQKAKKKKEEAYAYH